MEYYESDFGLVHFLGQNGVDSLTGIFYTCNMLRRNFFPARSKFSVSLLRGFAQVSKKGVFLFFRWECDVVDCGGVMRTCFKKGVILLVY